MLISAFLWLPPLKFWIWHLQFCTYALSFLLLPFNVFSTYYFPAIMKSTAAFIVSVARRLVISGILITIFPAVIGTNAIWFAMPATELAVMIYSVAAVRKYTKAL